MAQALYQWIDTIFDDGGRLYMKRLSGNDTLLTESHQAGPYIPKKVIFDLFPSLANSTEKNPRVPFTSKIVSDAMPELEITAIWYNGKVVGDGTRNECRITGWGGKESPLLDPEATGSVVAISFKGSRGRDVEMCEVWVCSGLEEEHILENQFGPVEPGAWIYRRQQSAGFYEPTQEAVPLELRDGSGVFEASRGDATQLSFLLGRPVDKNCRLTPEQIPDEWLTDFPSGESIIERAVSLRPAYAKLPPDRRLVKRRNCEYELFLSVEEVSVLPVARQGFDSVDSFVNFANSVTNRRKARSGRSLELHAKRIFDEENLESYSHDEVSEGKKRPDFLFPSAEAYRDSSFPKDKLRMLAAKTTCKDRWRQVADEASRIDSKHLLTLQEGVTDSQFSQMERAGIKLVVPIPLHDRYPKSLRGKLMSFESFIKEVQHLNK